MEHPYIHCCQLHGHTIEENNKLSTTFYLNYCIMFRCNGIVDNCCCFGCNTPILLRNFTIWKHREKGVLHGMRLQMAGCVPTEIQWSVPLHLSLCLMSWAVWNRKTPVCSHQQTWISGCALCHQCVASHHIHPDEQSRSLKSRPTRKDYILNGRSMEILGNNHRIHILRLGWDTASNGRLCSNRNPVKSTSAFVTLSNVLGCLK